MGGVSSNQFLMELLRQKTLPYDLPIISAPPNLCTDNAAMIAWMGWELKNA